MSTVPFNFFPKSEYLNTVKESLWNGFYPYDESRIVELPESRKSFIIQVFFIFNGV